MPESQQAAFGDPVPVLDKGAIQLLNMMGSDQEIIAAARVSTGTRAGADLQRDRDLIFFLAEHRHGTPFEHVVFQFYVRCPIFVARQWMRHRIASYNEASARYRVLKDEFYVPDRSALPDFITDEDIAEYQRVLEHAHQFYLRMIEKAKPHPQQRSRVREVFRGVIGTAIYTEFYWSVNLRSLWNFLELRTAPGAQYEIRQYAQALDNMVQQVVPIAYEALKRFGRA
ncbi:MAG: FAD-dependent thymidylate synthase [Chloroflexi bacterium]|nr:FAD-dependent thymidylate synthase [Chloroflexota bacterium]